jgi:CubicO group peptidase (beta-lactamase class C family)
MLERTAVDPADYPAVREVIREYWGNPLFQRATDMAGAFPEGLLAHNSPVVRAAELPGANLVTDARSLARLYAATVGEVGGTRLLRAETVEAACVPQTADTPLHGAPARYGEFLELFELRFALGFLRPTRHWPLLGPESFGHGGAGGSLGFADPGSRVGFGYVQNRLTTSGNDLRAANLVRAVRDSL